MGEKRKRTNTKNHNTIPLHTGIITLGAILPRKTGNAEKPHGQKLLLKQDREKYYNEIVKQLDCATKTTPADAPRNTKIIDEKKGYGWKGLGSRKILFDNERKEYLYEANEPHLTEKQEQLKSKLIVLFRKFADVDVFEGTVQEKWKIL
jgi:hypothetical protein